MALLEGEVSMIIGFWSPSRHAKVTTSMLTVAAVTGMEFQAKVLAVSGVPNNIDMERPFFALRRAERSSPTSNGYLEIERLITAGKLTPEGIKDNSDFIIRNKFDILSLSEADVNLHSKIILPVLEGAKMYYSAVFVDLGSESLEGVAELCLSKLNLLVVCLPQDMFLAEKVLERMNPIKDKVKNIIYCIGGYERTSSFAISKFANKFKIPVKNIGAVPKSVGLLDSINKNNIMDYLLRAYGVKKKFLKFDEESYFMATVKSMSKKVLVAAGIVADREEDV